MRPLFALILSYALATTAQAAPASPQSVETLMEITRADTMVDSMYGSMEQMMRAGMQQALQGKPLTAAQQRVIDTFPAKFMGVMREDFNWARLKPAYVQLYAETFDQTEIDGMIAFYRTPVGQAALSKMPTVMQKSMALSQSMMQTLIPKMQAAMQEAMEQAKTAK